MTQLGAAPLFVPGDRPDQVRKARRRGVRTLALDLEDAVPPERKDHARDEVVGVLGETSQTAHLVRVNAASDRRFFDEDVRALAQVRDDVAAVVLPKVRSADEVRQLADVLDGVPIVPTIEDAVGVREVWEIAAAHDSVHTLLFGVVDLSADLGVTATAVGTELLTARSLLVLACAAAGKPAPLDGPHVNVRDHEGLAESARRSRELGFGGKVVIHPDQIAVVEAVFSLSAEEVDWATRVVTAYDEALSRGVGVVKLDDGTFIDVPVAQRARAILARARTE